MPQELHVLKCCTCEYFQVHIVKKIPKWQCKLCGEKQSILKVFHRGTGKDCRLIVQHLNSKRLNQENFSVNENFESDSTSSNHALKRSCTSLKEESISKRSKWDDFVQTDDTIDVPQKNELHTDPVTDKNQPVIKKSKWDEFIPNPDNGNEKSMSGESPTKITEIRRSIDSQDDDKGTDATISNEILQKTETLFGIEEENLDKLFEF